MSRRERAGKRDGKDITSSKTKGDLTLQYLEDAYNAVPNPPSRGERGGGGSEWVGVRENL